MILTTLEEKFPAGLLRPQLLLGMTASISARTVGVNLIEAGRSTGSHYSGARYGRGEVGELVLIEGQLNLILGRISEVKLREPERRSIDKDYFGSSDLGALGLIQVLGSVSMDTLHVTPGVETYPRLGDRVFAAPHQFIALLPQLMVSPDEKEPSVLINLGYISSQEASYINVTPEHLFGRHCAILGATGGGKSWTTARIIQECRRNNSKLVLLDATGEYRNISGPDVVHCHLGTPPEFAVNSINSCLPPSSFLESDFIALFEPAGRVQGPKLRAAIRSLRLAEIRQDLATNGIILKHNQLKQPITSAEIDPANAQLIENPGQPFNARNLVAQLVQECVYPNGGTFNNPNPNQWGNGDESSYNFCLSLITRINGVLTSTAFSCVFQDAGKHGLVDTINRFLATDSQKLLRICLSGVSYEYNARETISNVIGRYLLQIARSGRFKNGPLLVLVDEAHNFLGKIVGIDDYQSKLDAFELIAKEGRKYGLSICLASQRPRDITEGVLSQIGTLIVHRLTNDRDRDIVERACGEIDRAASAFIPNLRPGQAAIIGTDFPIPLTIQMNRPDITPISEGPKFQAHWA